MTRNRLDKEKSPYLKQHKDNPIWWYGWGEEAFQAAVKEDKPIFLSIGYATCHWCHVMEGDSFTKNEIADILNEKFISIKVDREERPDVDAIYMSAVQSMTGQGGWPLSLFLNTDGKPFWGGTFMPRDRFALTLNEIARVWSLPQRAELGAAGIEIGQHLEKLHQSPIGSDLGVSDSILQKFYQQMARSFDKADGGFGGAPKFPGAMAIMMLFRIHQRTKSEDALNMGLKTLNALIRGGINDQLGGGFHRYSTDKYWLVPHFEKMLYDNALISMALLEAQQISQNKEYAEAAKLTLDYVITQMQDHAGGYYSAEDADSEKTEGKFYVWQSEELKEILSPEEFSVVVELYGIEEGGNFTTHKHVAELEKAAGLKELKDANILFLRPLEPLPDRNEPVLKSALAKMFKVRSQRIRPLLDTKILTAWNGLMIAAMAKAHQVLGEERYLDSAIAAASFIEKNLLKNGKLLRRYCDGEARFDAYLEDYSSLIFGLIELYQATFTPHWLDLAEKLQQKQNELFWDESQASYFDTDGSDKTLFLRTKEATDNATPSGNSLAALNLLKLFTFNQNFEYQKKAQALLRQIAHSMSEYPRAFPQMLQAADFELDNAKSVVIEGGATQASTMEALKAFRSQHFLPNKLLVGKLKEDGKTTIYVCEQGQCKLPTNDITEAVKLASQTNSYTV